ncbi:MULTISPECIES: phosphoribosyltransferase [unclassified Burkholderia]|uniref:phosphoribosyltransferase n=1 Tax=unclassified Burkholderia TaxID=2613784 RepID=UPI000F5687A1|nr:MULTISPECIES: phosphoribosyltransferase family protein [unclassified Burkholderia]RQR42623.1 phosphoribosyltransferase [Burkholderia sp. Bp9131]RQR72220.1 phosphoribosyltransferase [Burkholderia sp. Bp9015]RQR81120.1 phosphoribosyltransferase [Burkholderia sp. Bp9011]RQR90795.1 phosphoribosyltransferase [Burkholderia sp. Bp9010]RQR95266.1 phosphoribosyltransferase [Burkholderia sp. Bp8994]
MTECFADRADAGRQLALALHDYAGRRDVVVLALPRGGVPVAFPIAQALRAPLDVLVVRKLGMPSDPEFAIGAIATGGAIHLQHAAIRAMGVSDSQLADVIVRETAELQRRDTLYRGARPPLPVDGRIAIVVDDGIATGASMRVALQALRKRHPARIVVAAPVAPAGAQHAFDDLADAFVTVSQPLRFFGISQFYARFDQTGDDEVRALLDAARGPDDDLTSA